jgi:AcrR family transcriptional regulator
MGRPRDSSRDLAIFDATLSLLTEVGYEQLSMEAVAGRSGAAKTTIYRRYRDKAALVAAAVERRAPAKPPQPAGESLREDVHSLAAWLARSISEQDVGLLGALFAGMRNDARLAQAMRRILRRDETAMADGLVRQAADCAAHRGRGRAVRRRLRCASRRRHPLAAPAPYLSVLSRDLADSNHSQTGRHDESSTL